MYREIIGAIVLGCGLAAVTGHALREEAPLGELEWLPPGQYALELCGKKPSVNVYEDAGRKVTVVVDVCI